MAWTLSGEWTANDCPEYRLDVDEFRDGDKQMVFVHLLVHRWNKATFKKLKHDWTLFRTCVPGPVFTCGTDDDHKFQRFCSMFGWMPYTTIPCTDGKTRRLFIHINKNEKKNVLQIKRDAEH